MIQKLQLLFDLLDLQWDEAYVPAAQWIVDHPQAKIISSHRYAFAFQGFAKYVAGDMSEEEFLALGDISSPQVLSSTSEISSDIILDSLVFGVEKNVSLYANTFILLSKSSGLSIDTNIQTQLSAVWSYLAII